jgi:hypothetical protein
MSTTYILCVLRAELVCRLCPAVGGLTPWTQSLFATRPKRGTLFKTAGAEIRKNIRVRVKTPAACTW